MFRSRRFRNVLLVASMMLAPVSAFAQVSALEREMLLDFYQSTNGPRWLQSGGWNGPPGTECSWYGVTCAGGAVTQLRLPDNNLGEADASHPFAFLLPVEPVNLPALTHLDLAGNRFEQIVPNAYGSFPQLVSLDLGRLDLDTALPAQLGNVTTLQTLFLDRNRFTGPLPESWSQLTQLRNLDLYDNALTGALPSSWSAMTELRLLILGDDPGTALPDSALDGPIPASWGQLVQLQTLNLSRNALDGALPASFANLVALRRLDLDGNELQGELPAWIGDLANLEHLFLSGNHFEGALPASLGALTNLQTLSLFDNAFTGPLPAEVAGLSALRALSVQNNLLEGAFPAGLCGLANLEHLLLTSNRFSGGLPACLGQLTGLRKLGLGNNAFRGEVPASLVQLTALEALPDNSVDDGHLFFNALWTSDPAVQAFIDARFPRGTLVPDFVETQTLAPLPVQAQPDVAGAVRLQWTPRGQIGNGHFQILGAPSETLFCDGFDAPCVEDALLAPTVNVMTAHRGVAAHVVTGLPSGQHYRFVVLSVSEPNPSANPLYLQPNRLISDPAGVVGAQVP